MEDIVYWVMKKNGWSRGESYSDTSANIIRDFFRGYDRITMVATANKVEIFAYIGGRISSKSATPETCYDILMEAFCQSNPNRALLDPLGSWMMRSGKWFFLGLVLALWLAVYIQPMR